MTKKYKDVYEGATELANILGIHVDTLRKRAKAGKIPGTQSPGASGRWTFITANLAKAGIEPFASEYNVTALKKLTDVIFVLDRSSSMSGLIEQARGNLQGQINTLCAAATADNVYRVSVINFDSIVQVTARAQDVRHVGFAHALYQYPNGMTKLNDGVHEAMLLAKSLDTNDLQHAFLISIVTDGQENSSRNDVSSVASNVKKASGTDRYTFVYAGPHGSKGAALALGLQDGNITEWEQTMFGVHTLGVHTNSSLNSYTTCRGTGQTYSTSFYAAPVTPDAAQFAIKLDDKLDDVSSQVNVQRVTASDPVVIKKFCENKFGSFPKGKIYYQLTESEKVQDYKKLIIQDTATGNFYAGWAAAKKLLGLPSFTGTVKIKPGTLGEFKVFIQSTSVNRKLTAGTAVVYLP